MTALQEQAVLTLRKAIGLDVSNASAGGFMNKGHVGYMWWRMKVKYGANGVFPVGDKKGINIPAGAPNLLEDSALSLLLSILILLSIRG